MIMQLVGIYDRKAAIFISLEPTPNIAVATRQLTEIVNRQSDNPIAKWPEDYSLWELGTFDTESGEPAPVSNKKGFSKKLIVEASSLKQTTN